MLKNGIFCGVVILVVFKVFLVVKKMEILTQIVPDVSIYPYYHQINAINKNDNKCFQYVTTVALSHEKIGKYHERIS